MMETFESEETRKEIRRMLRRWGNVRSFCIRKQKELREYMDLIESVSDVHASALSGMPGSGQMSDKTARAAEKLMYLEEQYQNMIDALAKEIADELLYKEFMDSVLECVKDPARTVVEMKYKYCWSIEKIHHETHYSPASVKRLDMKALSLIAENIKISKVEPK